MFARRIQLAILLVWALVLSALLMPLDLHGQAEALEEQPFIFGGLAWSPDGSVLAVGTSNGISLHAVDDLSVVARFGESSFISSLSWSPDGRILVSGSSDGLLQVWRVEERRLLSELQGHTQPVSAVSWSPDGSLIASSSWDDTVRVWDASTYRILQIIKTGGYTTDYSVNWSPDGKQIATQGQQGIAIWNTDGSLYFSWPYGREIPTMKWRPDAQVIAIGSLDGEVRLWDAATGKLLEVFDTGYGFVFALAWKPDSTQLAASRIGSDMNDGVLQIWDARSSELVAEFPDVIMVGDTWYNNAVAWSEDGSLLASTSDNGKIYVWDADTYETLAVYERYSSIISSE